MNRIGNTPGGAGPVDPTPAGGPDKVGGSERAGETAGSEAIAARGAELNTAAPTTELASHLQATLSEGLRSGADREQVLQNAVEQVAGRVFGEGATPAMVESISQAMQRDPNLVQLVDSLMRGAGGAS